MAKKLQSVILPMYGKHGNKLDIQQCINYIYKCHLESGDHIKNLANFITCLRIIFAIILIFLIPFSAIFWIFYLCGGISDILDGFIARKMNLQSTFGVKLDSVADVIFATAIVVVVIKNIKFSELMWLIIVCIAFIRIFGYRIGFYKYHTFSALHTYANKLAGLLIFTSPMLYFLLGINPTIIILSTVALISAVEELIIIAKSKELNRDCRCIFFE